MDLPLEAVCDSGGSGLLVGIADRIGSSPLFTLQWLLISTNSSQPSATHAHFAKKPGVASQLLISYGSPQTISPLRPAVTSSRSLPDERVRDNGASDMLAGTAPSRDRGACAEFNRLPTRSCISSHGSKRPSYLIRLSRTRGKGMTLIQVEW